MVKFWEKPDLSTIHLNLPFWGDKREKVEQALKPQVVHSS